VKKKKMKRNGILCILIAAALLVTSLAAVSAQDQSSTIDQGAMQDNDNAIFGSQTAHAIGGDAIVGGSTINSMNVQAQSASVTQTGDTFIVGGDIKQTNITKCCECGVNQTTSDISQVIVQENTNLLLVNATATSDVVIVPCAPGNVTIALGDNATIGDGSTIRGSNVDVEIGDNATIGDGSTIAGRECEPTVVGGGNAFVGGQTIDSMNVQAQSVEVAQIGDTFMVAGDIKDSNIYKGPIVADGDGDSDGPSPSPRPPAGPGPVPRP